MKKNLNYLFLIFITFSLIACELGSDYTKTNQNLNNKNGAVSSTSSLASAAGIDIMKKGGNAFDAVVATGFCLAVTSPSNGNIGGGGFMVARTAEGEIVTLDFREKAPTLSYETMFLDQEGNYSRNLALLSHKSSGVPGTVDGLIRIFNDYGSGNFTLDEILSYAIDYAENGLVQKGGLKGFEIADENSHFLPAQARIENNYIVVSHVDIRNPKYVRYGWKNYFNATLFNREGLPASSFITD